MYVARRFPSAASAPGRTVAVDLADKTLTIDVDSDIRVVQPETCTSAYRLARARQRLAAG